MITNTHFLLEFYIFIISTTLPTIERFMAPKSAISKTVGKKSAKHGKNVLKYVWQPNKIMIRQIFQMIERLRPASSMLNHHLPLLLLLLHASRAAAECRSRPLGLITGEIKDWQLAASRNGNLWVCQQASWLLIGYIRVNKQSEASSASWLKSWQ